MSMLPLDSHRRLHERSDKADAARYRWLRENLASFILCEMPVDPATGFKPGLPFGAKNWPAGVDDAVDAVLSRQAQALAPTRHSR